MAIDTAKKRRASSGFSALHFNVGVTPDLTPDAFYRYAMQTNYGTGGVAPVGAGGRGSRYRLRGRVRTILRGTGS